MLFSEYDKARMCRSALSLGMHCCSRMTSSLLWWSCGLETCSFTIYGLPWSTTSGLISMHHVMVRLVFVWAKIKVMTSCSQQEPIMTLGQPRFSWLPAQRSTTELSRYPSYTLGQDNSVGKSAEYLWVAGSSLTAARVGFLASLSFQMAVVSSDHRGKNMEIPTSR